MSAPLITLTTDFGRGSPYVAAMKGALLTVNSDVHLVDLSHSLPPQDLRACSYFLRSAIPYFPAGTLHVVVVDPGVGTDRALLCVELKNQRLLTPDNGCWTEWARFWPQPPKVWKLTEKQYWRAEVSNTFHARDILAPVAGHLSLGLPPDKLGLPVISWVELALPKHSLKNDALVGEVLSVDSFGNLITNLPADVYLNCLQRIKAVVVDGQPVKIAQVRTYGDAAFGTLVILVSSGDTVEIAEAHGNAAKRLQAGVGSSVKLLLVPPV
jgi:S-adenosylmethionine hydrolase